jgi:hypothetical protein
MPYARTLKDEAIGALGMINRTISALSAANAPVPDELLSERQQLSDIIINDVTHEQLEG